MSSLPDPNTLLNLVTLVVILFGARPFLRAKKIEAERAEQDRVIKLHEQSIGSLEKRLETAEADIEDCRSARTSAEQEAREWRARYDEAARYTAGPALERIEQKIQEQGDRTVSALGRLEQAIEMWVAATEARNVGPRGPRGDAGPRGPSGAQQT